jgi:hypothetical protein
LCCLVSGIELELVKDAPVNVVKFDHTGDTRHDVNIPMVGGSFREFPDSVTSLVEPMTDVRSVLTAETGKTG